VVSVQAGPGDFATWAALILALPIIVLVLMLGLQFAELQLHFIAPLG